MSRKGRKQAAVLRAVESIVAQFVDRFESTYGGKVVIEVVKASRENRGWDVALFGSWYPSLERCERVKWFASVFEAGRIIGGGAMGYDFLFEITFHASDFSDSPTLKHVEVKNTSPQEKLSRQELLLWFFENLTQMPFENTKLAFFLNFLKNLDRYSGFLFLVRDLKKLAKGNYKGWAWWLKTGETKKKAYDNMLVGVRHLLYFRKDKIAAALPIETWYRFGEEESERETGSKVKAVYTVTLFSPLVEEGLEDTGLRIYEPCKSLDVEANIFLFGLEIGNAAGNQGAYSKVIEAVDEAGVVDAVEKVARHVIDTILSLSQPNADTTRIVKAAAVGYAVGITLSTYTTPSTYRVVGYWEHVRDVPQASLRPHLVVRNAWRLSLIDTLKEVGGVYYLGVFNCETEFKGNTTTITFSVTSDRRYLSNTTKTYSLGRDLVEASDDEVKGIILDFVRAIVPELRRFVRLNIGNIARR